MSSAPYNTEAIEPRCVQKPLRRIDIEEALDIENYMEQLTMERLDLLAHFNFLRAMEGMCDMPVQEWEWEVSSRLRVWI
tara:strand:- start:410 stop:646 length:237 start_codon:yes stop_codon:yes gene_type:complete